MKRSKRPNRLDHALDIAFAQAIRHTPAQHRPDLLRWLRRLRHIPTHHAHPPRTFYHLDPHTGHWHRL
jgi:hypothetical protein